MAIFYDYKIFDGLTNMRIDSELLEKAIKSHSESPALRLYGWAPACVSLGRNQKDDGINLEFCKKNNIDITKRLTGGRALLHDKELTYSFVCPASFLKNGETVIQSYKEISSALALGMSKLGINMSFPENKKAKTKFDYCMSLSTGADLSYQGKKLIGSAQYRKQGYILQHGSILFDYNKEKLENIFNEKVDEESLISIKKISNDITIENTALALKSAFQEYFNIIF
ncbi:MAG: lipoate--protein ligase family protein [Candidatus Gastranaerophilales bacterium]|nr:lipoate--protein ligase family protein [Candidatus Gastranaerophilales bacterium]